MTALSKILPATRQEALALALIMVLAAGLRFGWPGVNSFAFDEAHLSLIALDMGQNGNFARVGMPSSAGVPNLPAAAWVFSLPYSISTDPLLATQFVGLLSLLTVFSLWVMARHLWGASAGLVAALIIATAPYSVLYSRSIWAQNLLPVLATAWAFTAWLTLRHPNRWALIAHIVLAGFAFQVHFAGAALALGSLYFFMRGRWWRQPLALLIGGALVLLTLYPFINEIACCRPDIIARYRETLGGETHYGLQSFGELVRIALSADWGYLLSGDLQPADAPPLMVASAGLLLLGVVQLWRTRNRTHSQPIMEVIIVWLLCAPIFFIRQSTPVYVHYLLVSLPALALLMSAAATHRRYRQPAFLMAGVLAMVWSSQLMQGFALAGQTGTPNGLGTPLANSRAAAYGLPDDRPVVFHTHGDDPGIDGEAAVFSVLWWQRQARIVTGGSLLILPDHPAYLMATLQPIQAWEELQTMQLDDPTLSYPRRADELPYVATAYDPQQLPIVMASFNLLPEPVALADGAVLLGWRARMVGPRLRISTLWQAQRVTATAGSYAQFHHVYTPGTADPDSEPVAVSDVPIGLMHWQAGDHVIVMADFAPETIPQPFDLRIGHYTQPNMARIAVDGGGTSVLLENITLVDD